MAVLSLFGVGGAALCTVQQEIGETIDDSFLLLYVVLVVQYTVPVCALTSRKKEEEEELDTGWALGKGARVYLNSH